MGTGDVDGQGDVEDQGLGTGDADGQDFGAASEDFATVDAEGWDAARGLSPSCDVPGAAGADRLAWHAQGLVSDPGQSACGVGAGPAGSVRPLARATDLAGSACAAGVELIAPDAPGARLRTM